MKPPGPLCGAGCPRGAVAQTEGQCTHEGPRFFFKWETAQEMTSCVQEAHPILITLSAHSVSLDSCVCSAASRKGIPPPVFVVQYELDPGNERL